MREDTGGGEGRHSKNMVEETDKQRKGTEKEEDGGDREREG